MTHSKKGKKEEEKQRTNGINKTQVPMVVKANQNKILLTVNELSTLLKQRLPNWIKRLVLPICFLQETHTKT